MLKDPADIIAWCDEQRQRSDLQRTPITLAETRHWRLQDGRIVHDTGRFFGVVGQRIRSQAGDICQPFIDQPEIGLLGFLVRRHGPDHAILVQAKTEPGNVGGVQLAPSVQATRSNFQRLHGGASTPYLEDFRSGVALAADQLQSEQGTRFLGKYNRNATRLLDTPGPPSAGPAWHWCDVEALISLLHHDYAINTDARSVLVCGPWEVLAGSGDPFARWRATGTFGDALRQSHAGDARESSRDPRPLIDRLEAARSSAWRKVERVPVDRLSGWTWTDDGLFDGEQRHFAVRYTRVRAQDREVTDWDQPIFDDVHPIDVTLVCQQRDGLLRFLLRHADEPGFREKVQFGPTVQTIAPDGQCQTTPSLEPLQRAVLTELPKCRVHVQTWASDEGGRFDHNRTCYRIVELPHDIRLDVGEAEGSWATLAQVRRLLGLEGMLSNEARSALSLLLPFV